MKRETNFNQDIVIGEAGEDIVVKDLESIGVEFISKNKNNRYDLLMRAPMGWETTYEVKTDIYCTPTKDTGNMFIEFESRYKRSGIEVTEAVWFVTYYKHLGELWYILTEDLRKLIDENKFKKTEFSGDTGSNTKGWLIPRKQFEKNFIIRKT